MNELGCVAAAASDSEFLDTILIPWDRDTMPSGVS